MSKVSFRAKALDAFKSMQIYFTDEIADLSELSAINRAVPQMPSGMDKEEECEHHFQRAIVTGLIIPTPEVTKAPDLDVYNKIFSVAYKPPDQLICMQPFAMEEDYPDYDMDSEDERWLSKQKLEITPLKFEELMDRLEKNCAQNFATQDRNELLLNDNDELSIAIYDYWLNKRLKSPLKTLVPTVKTEANRFGGNNSNNPYLAFRRRKEKMQTRKNRKNDEASYEKMIRLKRDLTRALHLLDLVKRRETMKKELLQLTVQLYEKRYQANDLSGQLLAEVSVVKPSRPAFAPLYSNQFSSNHTPSWQLKPPKEDIGLGRKEKRQYKKRKHKGAGVLGPGGGLSGSGGLEGSTVVHPSSGDEELPASPASQPPPSAFPFHRNTECQYHAPVTGGKLGNWAWCGPEEGGAGEERYRYSLTCLTSPKPRCVGITRRRLGRGGRVVLDRAGPSMDDFWSSVDFKILQNAQPPDRPLRCFRPKTPPKSPPVSSEDDSVDMDTLCGNTLTLQVESSFDPEPSTVELNLSDLFPDLGVESLRQDIFGRGDEESGEETSDSGGVSQRSGSLLQRLVAPAKPPPPPAPPPPPPPTSPRPLHVGSSVFSFSDRTSNRVVNNRLDNIQFVFSESEPPPPPVVTTNGPLNPSADYSVSWLQGAGLPLLVKSDSFSPSPSPTPSSSPSVVNSKLTRPQPHLHNSAEGSEQEGMVRKSLVNSHLMEVT